MYVIEIIEHFLYVIEIIKSADSAKIHRQKFARFEHFLYVIEIIEIIGITGNIAPTTRIIKKYRV